MGNEPEQIFPRPVSGRRITTMPSAIVPARSQLSGRFANLEPQNPEKHVRELYQAGHESNEANRIWDYLAYGPWPNEESYLQTLRKQSASFDPIFFAIRKRDTGNVCGQASYLNINALHGVVEIGHIWFGVELQRTRSATEALYLLIKHAMDDLGYRRMEWKCNAMNEKSRQAARRLGFRFEGIFYNHIIFKGKNRDTAWYSILDYEWPEVRQNIEQWLDDSNFTDQGKAKCSLSKMMRKRPFPTSC